MKESKLVVCLDAGHGCNTPGKCSPDKSLREYAYCREIVTRLDKALREMGISTYIVTPEKEDITLSKRASRVNTKYAELKKVGRTALLISIHCNAAAGDGWQNVTGFEVWSTKKKNNSDDLANCFIDQFKKLFPDRKCRGHKENDWTILFKSNCPCVLTENYFMNSKADVEYLLSELGKNDIVQLHIQAICQYAKEKGLI